jgi:hypothetical protein
MMRTPVEKYADLRAAIDERRKQLGWSHLEMDHVTGWPHGYTGKLLCGMRNFGPMSLSCALDALGLEIVIEPADGPAAASARASAATLRLAEAEAEIADIKALLAEVPPTAANPTEETRP